MMIELTGKEVLQIQSLLPIQGNLKSLESAQAILDTVTKTEIKEIIKIDFSKDEINFMCEMIDCLDRACKINISSLSLIKKILNNRSK
jgi:hypothetical protein